MAMLRHMQRYSISSGIAMTAQQPEAHEFWQLGLTNTCSLDVIPSINPQPLGHYAKR